MAVWESRLGRSDQESQEIHVSHSAFSSILDCLEQQPVSRTEDTAEALSAGAPPYAAPYLKNAAPAIGVLVAGAEAASPYVFQAGVRSYAVLSRLPSEAFSGVWGLGICFYGGRYAAAIAAVEAFTATGGTQTLKCLQDVKQQFILAMNAIAEDSKTDGRGQGAEDAGQSDWGQFAQRKMALCLRTVDPDVLSKACCGLWSGYMGVLAVLKFKVAQTVALAHSIGDNLRPIAARLFGPSLVAWTPEEYRRWVDPAINFGCQMLAGFVAWRVQRVISTFQSGISGGLIAARAGLALLRSHRVISFGDDDTLLDEAAGYSLAIGGVYYQLVKGSPVPFWVSPVFWPMDMLEWWLKWSVTWMSAVVPDER